MIKVLIVADQKTIDVVERSLGSEPRVVVKSTSNGSNIKNLLESDDPPKIAFLNCSLVDNESIDLCKKVRDFQEESYTHLILLSDDGVQELVKYLEKDSPGSSDTNLGAANSDISVPLTKKQCEVLQLLSRGFSNSEIALRLDITTGTVKSHMNHILGKLGAANRTQALAKAAQSGLISLNH